MLAVDLGAQSGRAALGRFDGDTLTVTEVRRFANTPVRTAGRLYWDVLRLHEGLLETLRSVARDTNDRIESIAVDTWGVDFALLDRTGHLLGNPAHHRDGRFADAMPLVLQRIPARQLYARTGIQLLPINTIYQLAAMTALQDPVLGAADSFLMMPDLFHYWLSGVKACEFTNATTTQCYDPIADGWARDLLEVLGVRPELFPEVVRPGTVLGPLSTAVADETGLNSPLVVATASHDTASAVTAVPFRSPHSAYISSGTWSLVGVEVQTPVIDDRSFAANLTNEGSVAGTFRLLHNVTGLWLLHECRRTWALAGQGLEWDDLMMQAEQHPPLRSIVNVNEPEFLPPGDMPARIRDHCARAGEPVPVDEGAVTRCILESLAMKYRQTIVNLAAVTGTQPPEIHVVGGGALNRLLCQWTADATGLPVMAGPVEATQVGNILVQALALGELSSLDEARALVRRSFATTTYEPGDRGPWDEAYARLAAPPAASEWIGAA
jgi:rhamnulokinase